MKQKYIGDIHDRKLLQQYMKYIRSMGNVALRIVHFFAYTVAASQIA